MSGQSEGDSVLDHQADRRRIFIVHLRLDASPECGRLTGRVEHAVSRDAAHFESVDELVAFIAFHVLAAAE